MVIDEKSYRCMKFQMDIKLAQATCCYTVYKHIDRWPALKKIAERQEDGQLT